MQIFFGLYNNELEFFMILLYCINVREICAKLMFINNMQIIKYEKIYAHMKGAIHEQFSKSC